jgi:hypothetical protein
MVCMHRVLMAAVISSTATCSGLVPGMVYLLSQQQDRVLVSQREADYWGAAHVWGDALLRMFSRVT